MTCESTFRVKRVGLCGTQAKVVFGGVSNGVVAAVYRGSEKR